MKKGSIKFTVLIVFIMAMAILAMGYADAQTANDPNSQINDLQEKLTALTSANNFLEAQIEQLDKQIKEIVRSKKTLEEELSKLKKQSLKQGEVNAQSISQEQADKEKTEDLKNKE